MFEDLVGFILNFLAEVKRVVHVVLVVVWVTIIVVGLHSQFLLDPVGLVLVVFALAVVARTWTPPAVVSSNI